MHVEVVSVWDKVGMEMSQCWISTSLTKVVSVIRHWPNVVMAMVMVVVVVSVM